MGVKTSKLKTKAILTAAHDDAVMVDSLELSIEKTSCWGRKRRLLAAFAFPRQGWSMEPSGGMSCRCLEAAAMPLERLRKKRAGRAVNIRCLDGGRQVFASEVSLAELLLRLDLTARDGEATLLFNLGTGENEGGEASSASFNVLLCNGLRCVALDSTPKEPQHRSPPETSDKDETDLALQEQKNEDSVKVDADSLACSQVAYDNINAFYSVDDEGDGYEADDEDESVAKEVRVYKAIEDVPVALEDEDDISVGMDDEGYDGDDEDESLPSKRKVYMYNDGGYEEEHYEGDHEDNLEDEECCEDTREENNEDEKTHKQMQAYYDDCWTVEEEDDKENRKEFEEEVVCPGGELEWATNIRRRHPPTVSHRPVTATREARPVRSRGDSWLGVVVKGLVVVFGALYCLTLWLDYGRPLWRHWRGIEPHPAMPSEEIEWEEDEFYSDPYEYYYDPRTFSL